MFILCHFMSFKKAKNQQKSVFEQIFDKSQKEGNTQPQTNYFYYPKNVLKMVFMTFTVD